MQTHERAICDDKNTSTVAKEYHQASEPVIFKNLPTNNHFVVRIREIGKKHGIQLEVCYAYQLEKIIIFATNVKGHRWQFMDVEEPGGGYRPLDARAVRHVEQIFYINQSLKKKLLFFRELRLNREKAKAKSKDKACDDLLYMARQYRRTFQALSRIMGLSRGKTKTPFGPVSGLSGKGR